MPDKAQKEAKDVADLILAFFRWLLMSIIIGGIGGFIGAFFHVSVNYATDIRAANPWLLWCLPLGGVVIAALYKLTKMETTNTNAIIDSIHFGDKVPVLLAPVIFIATTVTHLCGGSAGREGAALQIGGGIGCNVGTFFKLDDKDMRLATLCGMSAVFSALFGTPLTAALFALEVISVGVFYYSGIVPCIVSAVTAYGVTLMLNIAPTKFAVSMPALDVDMLWRVAILAILCAAASTIFCIAMHGSEKLAARVLPNNYIRAAVGGALIIGLTLLVGTTDYNGAGMDVITNAIELGSARPSAAFWKLVFTAVTLACGFRGGEVVPTFFIGATLGCVIGPLLGIPAGFSAALGLIAVFCGAVNCPVASIVMSIELFGSTELIYFAVACGISYMLSGYFGLYSSQKIMYSKTRAEFINIQAK